MSPWLPIPAGFTADWLPGRIEGLVPEPTARWDDVMGAESPPQPTKRPSAVVMLFLPPLADGQVARIVLIRRSTTIRSHRGQIAFPGGRAEPDDGTPTVTALRELHEELGLAPERVTPIGFLPGVPALDGSAVVTVVGAARAVLDELTPSPDEVDSVFAEPWTKFTRAEDKAFRFNIFGNWRDSHLFPLPRRPVWGLTAWILAHCDFAG